ncbi:tubulin polyglutamylase TTLL5 isoform X1 [Aplysia californica]|uniref:Tubulin--tyrosine ligase-like protein 5 n=1 Tax=Aplysia californica TaxID=6500 RepID=A0ABM0JLU3_APLCA|nr:tubulin polyglutamylase TTLL5 isoform X1 [Aplysia californica]
MAARESRAADSDGNGSMTPSEQSDNDERSEHDSDYESDDGEDHHLDSKGKSLNVQWTGYSKRVPVVLFNAETVLSKRTDLKTVGERYHLAFKFASTECKIVRNIFSGHGFHEVHPNSADYNLIWSNSHLKPFTLRTMSEFQKINHFPRSYELTRKDRLFKNVQRMQQIKGHKHFDFIPPSFVLPGDYQDFCSSFLKDKGPYIVKPVASSRGRGVFLINHPDQVPLDENLIVSKYIATPLVIDGFKFDIRIYVAVTSYDPLMIYLYEEGITRFATVKYEKNVKHIRNQCMHLTNYSVNKRSQDYVKNDDPDIEDYGNKWSMGAMLRYLRSEGKDTAALMMRIEDVVIKTILSVESSVATACKMFQPYRGNCFELYGFDILLDENLKPWVLEVNLSPSLACDSPLDLKIKCNMLCDLFSLAGVICHDPMMRTMQPSKRNQEVTAKLGANRAKSPKDENTNMTEANAQLEAARQNMKKADEWLLKKTRPQSAATSTSKERQTGKGMAGLNSEEIKILRRAKEEEGRRGGWIRIFPTADSWDTHGSFLQFQTTHNLMLHQRLYPERHKAMTASKTPGTSTITPSRSKNGIQLQVTGSGKAEQEKFIESYAQALLRAKQYERRLGQGGKSRRHKKKQSVTAKSSTKRGKLVQGVPDSEENAENQSDEETVANERGKDKKEKDDKKESEAKAASEKSEGKDSAASSATASAQSAKGAAKESAASEKKEDEKAENPKEVKEAAAKEAGDAKAKSESIPPPPASPPPEPKYDVIGLLEKGQALSKVQARTAFAMYLIRVQQRLLSDCGGILRQEDVDALNEQMDLVLRFLKRAAINLPQAFRVVVPSKKLPLGDRRRILAKQLGDFVHIYNKETDHLKAVRVRVKMENKKTRKSDSSDGLDEHNFDQFVYTATEGELEEVLTTYTKINKSAAIFLGGDPKPGANTLSEAKREMLSRRRENPDITDGTMPVGTMDDASRARHVSGSTNNNCLLDSHSGSTFDLRTDGGGGGFASRPGSAQPYGSAHSYSSAVSIYSQRLSRPRSASSSGASRPGRTLAARPASAAMSRPSAQPQQHSIFTTSDPVVDTYNEKAIQDALQRLALKQQARQYSAVNGTNVLKADMSPTKPPLGLRPGSASSRDAYMNHHTAMAVTGQSQTLHSPVTAVAAYSRPGSQSGGRYMTMEGQTLGRDGARSNSRQHSAGMTSLGRTPSYTNLSSKPPAPQPPQQGNVHMQNANATFNSFIEDQNPQWQNEIASAYSEVTGVPPQNYHAASINSRQYQIAQQQALKQRMLEQSKAMLEQSKAKHDALVTQAQTQQFVSTATPPLYSTTTGELGLDLSPGDPEAAASAGRMLMPKPPVQPSSYKRPTNGTRINRKPTMDESNLNFNFYSSLMATGQGSQT